MVNERKIEIVEELTDEIREAQDLVFTNFKGLTVDEMETLRQDLYEEESRFRVVKNRLAERAFRQAFSDLESAESEPAEPDEEEAESPAVSLGDISGLGPSKVEALEEEGFDSVQALAEADLDDLTQVSGIGEATAEKFQSQAQELLESDDGDSSGDQQETSDSEPVSSDELLETIDDLLVDNTAIALSGDGYVNMAEVLVDFSEEHEQLEIKGGLLNGGFLEPDEVESVSELPSRRELLTSLAGALQKPLQNLVHHLQYPIQKLSRTLNEVKNQKEENEENES